MRSLACHVLDAAAHYQLSEAAKSSKTNKTTIFLGFRARYHQPVGPSATACEFFPHRSELASHRSLSAPERGYAVNDDRLGGATTRLVFDFYIFIELHQRHRPSVDVGLRA